MLTQLCARHSLLIIYHQYERRSPDQQLDLEKISLSRNKIMDLLTACPNFGEFFDELEKKNKRFMISVCEIVEIKPRKKYLQQGSPVDKIVIVLKGELMMFDECGPGKVYKSGDILGTLEMLYGMTWTGTAIGRYTGYLIMINKDYLLDLCQTFAKPGRALLSFFVEYECKRIRSKYKHRKLGNEKPQSVLGDLFGNILGGEEESKQKTETEEEEEKATFLEFDVRKKNRGELKSYKKREKDILKPFMNNLEIPPLFSHKVFEVFSAPEQVELEDVQMMDEDGKRGPGTFLRMKIENQIAEDKKRRKEMRRRKRKGLAFDDLERNKDKGTKVVKNGALEAMENVREFYFFSNYFSSFDFLGI